MNNLFNSSSLPPIFFILLIVIIISITHSIYILRKITDNDELWSQVTSRIFLQILLILSIDFVIQTGDTSWLIMCSFYLIFLIMRDNIKKMRKIKSNTKIGY